MARILRRRILESEVGMRLIDADTLIKDYKEEFERIDFEKLSDNDKLIIATSAEALINFTKRQPTAYDVDKVVEELENKLSEKKYQHDGEDYYVGICDAIDIVKRGVK